ncbi:flagellar biosynthesis protein FlgI [Halioglobus sp. HI00S01]|uniref:flagellar basal body P-ring protein FlgI n=1 Tax=Halioglobus sp. HI00S01 TaxID=1822214 RepID=UPI0007C3D0A0|nr:flagellar basal body P-ring protein FlgI [Halioglobus sp. HI00S01]KZX54866.1 flagellar biosynthesis protein FlgI [Halioglobus sp. HI00S01]
MYVSGNVSILARLLLCLLLLVHAGAGRAERIGELADFVGVRSNALIGYGLVVGLDGTGDRTMQAPFTGQALANMLSQLGISIPQGANMQLRNIAAVVVTAELPPFARSGQTIDLNVSSIGNAQSLRGGSLLMTPLKGVDGLVYAIGQGNIHVGGVGVEAGGSGVQINQLAGGRVPDGGMVERTVPLDIVASDGSLTLQLKRPDFDNARLAAKRINEVFDQQVARPVDGSAIRLSAPEQPGQLVNFMATIENIEVDPRIDDSLVIVNSRTGSVVMNSRVTLRPAAVAHGNLSITIDTRYGVSQPGPFADVGRTVVTPDTEIVIDQGEGALHMMEGAALADVVSALNIMGASPVDLMSILEALKAAGSLRASLKVI